MAGSFQLPRRTVHLELPHPYRGITKRNGVQEGMRHTHPRPRPR